MPAIARILRRLFDEPGGTDESELFLREGAGDQTGKALETLAAAGLVTRKATWVALSTDEELLGKARKMVDAFDELDRVTRASLTARALLNAPTHYRCLIHRDTLLTLLEGEGISTADAVRALARDEAQGYLEHMFITYRSRGQVKERFFPFIPYHHYEDFADMTGRIVEAVGDGSVLPEHKLALMKEDYLLGNYPEALAEQARRYLSEKNEGLLRKVQNEAFDIIWFYDRY